MFYHSSEPLASGWNHGNWHGAIDPASSTPVMQAEPRIAGEDNGLVLGQV
jgi:hypothetical protein